MWTNWDNAWNWGDDRDDDMDQDEPWGEEQWEAFLHANDRRVARYMELLHGFLRSNPRPDAADAEALAIWKRDLRGFIDRKGWTRDDLALPFLWLEDQGSDLDEALPSFFEPPDDADDLPASAAHLGAGSAFGSVRHLAVYRQATALTATIMTWADDVPGNEKDSTFVQFCSNIMEIPAQVAKGHALGFEQDTIGGNIACVKRALQAANAALSLLRQLRDEVQIPAATYQALYEETYEMRNALGIYVQDLRTRFNLGID